MKNRFFDTNIFGIKYLIALDRDFEGKEEYRTPKEFVEIMWENMKDSKY